MALKKIAVAAWALIPVGAVVFAAGTMLAQEPGPKGEKGAGLFQRKEPTKEIAPVARDEKPKAVVDPLERELLDAALQRLEAQRAYYEKGRITLDRFIAASERLMDIERMVGRTKEEVLAAIQRHVDLLKEIEAREQAELTLGKGTVADVAEAHQSRLQAEVLLKKTKMPEKTNPDLTALEHRIAAKENAPDGKPKVLVDPLERELLDAALQRLEAQRAYYEEGRITLDRFIMGSEQLMETERMVSRTKQEVLAAIQRHVDRLKEIEAREDGELKVGKGTVADLAEAHQGRLQAEVLLKKTKMPEKTNPDPTAIEQRLSEVERKLELLLKQGDGNRTRR